MTAFSDDNDFVHTILSNAKGDSFKCWLRSESGKFTPESLRSTSDGFLTGFMVEPIVKPSWLIPGVIVTGVILGVTTALSMEPSFNYAIVGLDAELGEKIRFSFVINSEFSDNAKL